MWLIIEKYRDNAMHDKYGTQSIWSEPTREAAEKWIEENPPSEEFTYWTEKEE